MGGSHLISFQQPAKLGIADNWLRMRSCRGPLVGTMAQSVKHPILVQVLISWFMSSSPALGSVLTAQSPEPALDPVSPSLSAPPPLSLCLTLSLKNK